MKHIVGVADMKVAMDSDDLIVTHSLGSCLGISAHDATAGIGGLVHVMMPQGRMNPEKAAANPFMFVDTGVPVFFRELYKAGAAKNRLVVKVAGGANINGVGNDRFEIGKRNYLMLKKLLWKNNILISGDDTGGTTARTMYLEIGTGRTWLSTAGTKREI